MPDAEMSGYSVLEAMQDISAAAVVKRRAWRCKCTAPSILTAILGHAQLTTTEIYTHVSIAKLKEIHALTHPAERPRVRGYELDEAERATLLDSLATLRRLTSRLRNVFKNEDELKVKPP